MTIKDNIIHYKKFTNIKNDLEDEINMYAPQNKSITITILFGYYCLIENAKCLMTEIIKRIDPNYINYVPMENKKLLIMATYWGLVEDNNKWIEMINNHNAIILDYGTIDIDNFDELINKIKDEYMDEFDQFLKNINNIINDKKVS